MFKLKSYIIGHLVIALVIPISGKPHTTTKKGIYPIITYSKVSGISIAGMLLNQSPKWDSHAILVFSEKYGKLLICDAKDISLSSSITIEATIELYDWKDSYFELGNTTSTTEQLIENTAYTMAIGPRYWISDKLSTALLLKYNERSEKNTKVGPFSDEKNLGTILNIQYRNRDNRLSPNNGSFLDNTISIYPSTTRTGRTNFITWTTDYRYYHTRGKHTWATRTYLGQTLSTREKSHFFNSQFRLGNYRELRGERNNRYMGRAVTLFQIEYRYKLFQKLRSILFIESGQTTDHIGINDLHVTKGMGLHYIMKHNIIARLEAGFSNDNNNILFSFNTAF